MSILRTLRFRLGFWTVTEMRKEMNEEDCLYLYERREEQPMELIEWILADKNLDEAIRNVKRNGRDWRGKAVILFLERKSIKKNFKHVNCEEKEGRRI